MLIQICTFSNSSSSLPKPFKYLQQLPKDYKSKPYVVCNILQVLPASTSIFQGVSAAAYILHYLPATTIRVYQ